MIFFLVTVTNKHLNKVHLVYSLRCCVTVVTSLNSPILEFNATQTTSFKDLSLEKNLKGVLLEFSEFLSNQLCSSFGKKASQ